MALNASPPDFEVSEGPTEPLFDEDDANAFQAAGVRRGRHNWFRIYQTVYGPTPSVLPPDNTDPETRAVYALPGNTRVAFAILIESMDLAVWADKRFVFSWKVHNQSRHADNEVGGTLSWRYTTSGHEPVRELQAIDFEPLLIGPGRWKAATEREYHGPFQSHFSWLSRTDIQAVFTLYTIRRK